MTWQIWFQSDLNFNASIQQLRQAEVSGAPSLTHPGIYYFNFIDSRDVQYEITTGSKLMISFPGEYCDYTKHLNRVKPFLVRLDLAPAIKFDIYTVLKDGKIYNIEKIKHRIEEADSNLVQEIMEVINKEKNENVLLRRINELKQLSWNERVAHYPEVRLGITELLKNLKVIRNPEVFKESVYALAVIIYFEQRNKSPNSEELIEEIVNANFSRIISVIEDKPDFLGYPTLFFLGRSGRKEAVDFIFEWIRNNPEKAQQKLENLASALGKQNLYKKYKIPIDQHLDNLMRNGDETLLQIAIKLDEMIRLRM